MQKFLFSMKVFLFLMTPCRTKKILLHLKKNHLSSKRHNLRQKEKKIAQSSLKRHFIPGILVYFVLNLQGAHKM